MENDVRLKKVGRPMKYREHILALQDDTLYSPGAITRIAYGGKPLKRRTQQDRLDYQRLRLSLGRLSHNHNFPAGGDGLITLPGQKPAPAWFGWRWKLTLLPHYLELLEDGTLYSPAQIARNGGIHLLIKLNRWVKTKGFPPEGDGKITPLNQAPIPAWWGWRWKRVGRAEILQ